MDSNDKLIRKVLSSCRILAVVGMSRSPGKAAYRVPRFLEQKGYTVIPVNPNAEAIKGQKSHAGLSEIREDIDAVVIFRPSEEVLPVVREAVDRHFSRGDVRVIWMQEGIQNDAAARLAEDAGICVVQDRCMAKGYRCLMEG